MSRPLSYPGKLADPEFRKWRASNAARSRTTVEHHIKALVDAAPELSEDQRSRLARLLRTDGGERE